MRIASIVALSALCGAAQLAEAQLYNEVEANETKALASANNTVTLSMTPNGTTTFAGVTGISTALSATGANPANSDIYRIRSAPRTHGIYFNTLTARVPAAPTAIGNFALARRDGANDNSLGQVGIAGGVDPLLGTGARASRWYSWGAGNTDEVYYQAATFQSQPYEARYSSVAVTPDTVGTGFDVGPSPSGLFTITTRGLSTSDTRIILLDGTFNQLRWNDNSPPGIGGPASSIQSTIVQALTAGTYYVAVATGTMIQSQSFESIYNATTNPTGTEGQTAVTFPIASRTDFANTAFSTTQITGVNNVGLSVSLDGAPAVLGPARSVTLGGFAWYQFTVIPTPSSAAILALGSVLAARRRRR